MRSPLSGIQSPFGPSGRPSWVAPGSAWTSVFSDNRYYRKQGGILPATSVLATTRSSPINLPDAAGVYQSLGNDTLPRTDRGLYANGQRVNKIDHFNLSPTTLIGLVGGNGNPISSGYVSVVDDTAALSALVNGGNGNAYKMVIPASAASGTYVVRSSTTATGNTNTHTSSAFVRGNGVLVTPGITGVFTPSYTATTETYTRLSAIVTPSTGSTYWNFIVNHVNGVESVAYFILAQFEEGSFASPPIATAGAPATLFASDIRAVQGVRPSNGQPEPFDGWEAAGLDAAVRLLANVRIDRLSANSPRFIAGAGVDANNLWRLIFDTDNRFKLIVRKSGSDVLTLQTGVAGSVGLYTVDARAKPGDYALTATGLSSATSASAETLPSGATTLRVGSNFGFLSPFNGWIEKLEVLRAA